MRSALPILLAAGMLAGCAEDAAAPDPRAGITAPVRAAIEREGPLPASAPNAATPASADPEAARAAAARGFVRRAARPAPPSFAPEEPGANGRAGDITLDFEGADLAAVVRVLLEDGLGATYVLDPAVRGTVTLRTNRPLRRAEILPTLEEILRLNDAAIVERDGTFRVVPRAQAGLSAPLVTARDLRARGLTLRITPLRFVRVDEIQQVLEGFQPAAGAIRFDPRQNLVFSTATAAEQRTIMNVIAALDRNQFAGRSFALRPLRQSEPEPVVEELEALFAEGGARPVIRFLPIQRMNAVLVISEDAVLLDEALQLIRGLDQGAAERARLHVFTVTNRRASDLAVLLGELFDVEVSGAESAATNVGQAAALAPSLSPTIGSTVGGGAGGFGNGAAEDGGGIGDTGGLAPAAAPAADAGGNGGGSLGAGGSARTGAGGVVRIVADEASDAIMALATADGARAVANALRRLDVQPVQVMIEATLVEVELNDALEYGVRWFLETGNFSFGFGDLLGTGAATVLPGFNAAFRTDDVQVTLSALDSVTDVSILSSPTLMVLDNQVARLRVGDQVPVTTRTATSVEDPLAPIVGEVEYRDTGVILDIRPSVNAGGLIVLEVRQEVSDVVATPGSDNPTFAQRSVQSTIAVQSGETIGLAGLIEESASSGREGIPVLSRLPVVGSAFGVTETSTNRSELIVLIRPIVVRDQTEAFAATQELGRKLSTLLGPGRSITP
ncbi:MAG: type II secretion system secretin GspD [Pseudomonadota bacterium]